MAIIEETQKITENFHALVPPLVIAILQFLAVLLIFILLPPLCPNAEVNTYKLIAMVIVSAYFLVWTGQKNKFIRVPQLGKLGSEPSDAI